MFIFLCIISSKNKDITCLNETDKNGESQGDGGFTKDNLVDLIFKYSMWCVSDKVKRVDKYRDLYIELIIYMSDNMDDTNGIRKKVDEYVDKVWEKLKLGKCEVGSEYKKNVGQITAALKLMKERDVPFPSDLCKELEFDNFTVNDVYYFYIDYFIRQLFCEKAQCYNKDSDKKKKLEFLENLGKSDATKVIEDISSAYKKLKDNKFQSLNFHISDLKTEKRSIDSFIKDYKDKVKDDSYAIYKKSYTELYKQKSIEFCKNRKENEEAYLRPIDEMFLLTRSDYLFKTKALRIFSCIYAINLHYVM